ncbi:hypothetical protein M0R45_006581 [Rubus argutus]|uniref:Uncharacterized protein n=1 Tax=Rubus argutus TaxID=59490 RepID=A0AAW1YR04_RUBAR
MIPPPLGPIDLDSQQRRHTTAEPSSDFPARRRSTNPAMAPSRPSRLTFVPNRARPCPALLISSSAFYLERGQSHLSHSPDGTEPSSLRRLSAQTPSLHTQGCEELRLDPLRFSTAAVLETPTINPTSRSFSIPCPGVLCRTSWVVAMVIVLGSRQWL